MFSGMEAASVAARNLDWDFVAFSEIEPSACWTLHHHYGCGRPVHLPQPADAATPKEARARAARIRAVSGLPEHTGGSAPVNLGDMTQVDWTAYRDNVDIVVGGPPCFPQGTLILARDGFVAIEDIKVGDEVLTHNNRWRRVLKTMSRKAETTVVKGQGHWGLETTPEHPFWARAVTSRRVKGSRKSGGRTTERIPGNPEWTEAQRMAGLYWSSPCAVPSLPLPPISDIQSSEGRNMPSALNEDFMWLVGAWVGDGWLGTGQRSGRPAGQTHGSVLLCGNKAHREIISERISRTGLRFEVHDERTTVRFSISAKPVARWIEAWFGRGSNGKVLPTWLLGIDASLRQAFLDGYLFADGHVHVQKSGGGRVRKITTVNKALAVGVRLLANSLGHSASIVRSAPRRSLRIEGRKVTEQPFFQVSIYDRARSAFVEDDMMWGRVRKVVASGRSVAVFNFEVEEDNSYVADGIVVHNCQAFSWAGNRLSLDDHRGNLSLAYVRAIHAIRPLLVFTENVPGWLSTKDNAFGCYLGALVGADSPLPVPGGGRWGSAGIVDGPDYRAAWRTLNAEGFVPQRRRRVFVVAARAGSGGNPVSVLLETESEARGHLGERSGGGPLFPFPESMQGNPEAGDSQGKEPAVALQAGAGNPLVARMRRVLAFGANRCSGETDVAAALTAHGGPNGRQDFESEVFLLGMPEDLGLTAAPWATGRAGSDPDTPAAFCSKDHGSDLSDVSPTLRVGNHDQSHANSGAHVAVMYCVASEEARLVNPRNVVVLPVRDHASDQAQEDVANLVVRRLTPAECLSLQGFPEGYLDGVAVRGRPLTDGPRYKLCGNSWAVPLVRWVFERMDMEFARRIAGTD